MSIDLICNVVIELGSLYVNLCTSKIAIKFVGTFSPNLICETSTFFPSTKCTYVCSTYVGI